jgi:hypothetical protein
VVKVWRPTKDGRVAPQARRDDRAAKLYAVRAVLQLAYGFALIAALLAVQAALLYGIWWLVLAVVSYVPIIGRKHKHPNWDRLDRESSGRWSRR